MGHVYKLKGRTVWNIKYYDHGRPIYESSRSPIKSEAVTLLKLREGAVASGLVPKTGRLRAGEAFKSVVRDYTVNHRASLSDLQRRIDKHLEPFFGNRRMSTIRADDVKAYVDHRREQHAAAATINRELAVLKRAFSLAMRTGSLVTKPYIPMLDERNARTGFFEKNELDALCRELPEPLRPVMRFAYYTGWRIRSEVLPLTWDRVDAESVRLHRNMTKNKEGRVFPYAEVPALKRLIDEQRARRQGPYVFHADGEPLSDWYSKAWRAACERAGLDGKIPHDFRRTAVRNLVRAGVAEKTAMLLTGHKTRSVFDRYDIVTLADLKAAVRKIR